MLFASISSWLVYCNLLFGRYSYFDIIPASSAYRSKQNTSFHHPYIRKLLPTYRTSDECILSDIPFLIQLGINFYHIKQISMQI